MQPHKPFIDKGEDRTDVSLKEWSVGASVYLPSRNGGRTIDEVEEGFIENLRYVLEEVELLLSNIDAETVVITSDHGQAMGEDFLLDHTKGVVHESMRRVPWAETTATDKRTLTPNEYELRDEKSANREEQLRALGYR